MDVTDSYGGCTEGEMNMKDHKRAPLFLLAILSLLIVPLAAEAGDRGEKVEKASLSAMRGEHAVVSFGAEGPVAIELHGKLFDPKTGQPVAEAPIELVRFEVDDDRSLQTVTAEEATASAREVVAEKTARHGEFRMTNLAPGRYSLQVDWDEVPAGSTVVRWELRWTERPAAAAGSGS